jgi:hypothetical protein
MPANALPMFIPFWLARHAFHNGSVVRRQSAITGYLDVSDVLILFKPLVFRKHRGDQEKPGAAQPS